MKKIFLSLTLIVSFFVSIHAFAGVPPAETKDFYTIKVYHVSSNEQLQQVDAFLKDAYLPALHRIGIAKTGVFHLSGNDTLADKRIYVFIPLTSLDQLPVVEDLLVNDASLAQAAGNYWSAAYNAMPYNRIESIVLKAFPMMTHFSVPQLGGNKTERVYELRSYEGPTERLYRKKVEMFNKGGEVSLFKRLGFNAVFYAEVIAGSRMPNLMYMTSFNNRAAREEHWNSFKNDPEWKTLSALPEYEHTVSKSDILLLNPTEFSEI